MRRERHCVAQGEPAAQHISANCYLRWTLQPSTPLASRCAQDRSALLLFFGGFRGRTKGFFSILPEVIGFGHDTPARHVAPFERPNL